ncbi:hypothetical protein D3C78_1962620 [compost metagenome]
MGAFEAGALQPGGVGGEEAQDAQPEPQLGVLRRPAVDLVVEGQRLVVALGGLVGLGLIEEDAVEGVAHS